MATDGTADEGRTERGRARLAFAEVVSVGGRQG